MRILIFIFLIFHVNFLKCSDLPKHLKCVDDSCHEEISTGRILKSTKSIHGNLGVLKPSSKVKIRGKNNTPENTLWLIEQDGNYGFLDLSHIKENTNNANNELISTRNPYYKKTSDETEDDDDEESTNETSIFSKGGSVKTNDISVENDETENFSEDNHNLQKEIGKSTNINSEFDATKDSDSLKNDVENSNPNKKSETVNSLKSQIDNTKNDVERDTQQSIDSINTLDSKNKKITPEIHKNHEQKNETELKQSNENVKSDKTMDNLKFQNQDNIKHEEIKDNLQNKGLENGGLLNKEPQVEKGIDETLSNRKEENVSQIPIKATETKSDIQETNKLPEKSTKSENSIDQLPKEKLENVKPDEQKKSISVNPDELSKEKNVEKSQINDMKTIGSPVENVKEKIEEMEHSISNNPRNNEESSNSVGNHSKNVENDEINKKLTNISSSLPSEEENENKNRINQQSEPNLIVEHSKNSENIPKESIKSVNKDSQPNSQSVHSKPDEKKSTNEITGNNNVSINQENIPKSQKTDEKLHEKSENVNIESLESDFRKKHNMGEQTEKIDINNEKEKKNEEINKKSGEFEKINKKLEISEKPAPAKDSGNFNENEKINNQNEKEINNKETINNNENEKINNQNEKEKKNKEILESKSDKTWEKLENFGRNTPMKEFPENVEKINNHDEEMKKNKETDKEARNLDGKSVKTSENFDKNTSVKESGNINENEKINNQNEKEKKNKEILEGETNETNKKLDNFNREARIKSGENQPIKSDPWFVNNGKSSCVDNENDIRSPVIKLIMKLDRISQIIIKSITVRLGFDSSSKLHHFTTYWFQMSLENFVSIFLLFSFVFLVVYSPKLLRFNRDWKSEFLKQSQSIKQLESKLDNTEEVRHKLSVQNHNFEKVIDEYKQQINEIQEDARKNKNALLLEFDKIKKTNESIIKNLNIDLMNKTQHSQELEAVIADKIGIIDKLQEEKEQLEIDMETGKSEFEMKLLENRRDFDRISISNEQLKQKLEKYSGENEELRGKIEELNENLIDRNRAFSQLENLFEQLKLFDGLDVEELNKKKLIYLDLNETKRELESAKEEIDRLTEEMKRKSELIDQLVEDKSEMNRKLIDNTNQKTEAVALKEAAEMKLSVLSEYFKSKEVEMAKTLGHQVIESTQSMDQVDYLKHRIQILESESEDLTKTVCRLKSEVKDAQIFATKCKTEANEEINKLFIKCSNLERSLLSETDENKKLRIKLSRYCGPTPPRNNPTSTLYNANTKDRPSSRQSGFSDSVGTFAPLPFIPFTPQSPTIPNSNSQFSGRNSVNSKKSNNT